MSEIFAAVDFETYYDKHLNLARYGMKEYARKAEAYLVSIVTPEGQYVGHPSKAPWHELNGKTVVSHNAAFDRGVFFALQEKGLAPEIFPNSWECTANMSVYLRAGRSLKSAVKILLGRDISKDVRTKAKGKTWLQMQTMQPINGVYRTFADEMTAYGLADSQDCLELAEYGFPLWPAFERELSDMTIRMCYDGMPVDVAGLEKDRELLQNHIFEAKKSLPWWDGDDGDVAALSPLALAKQCREVGIEPPKSMAKDSEECKEWEDKYSGVYPWVGAMRTIRRCNRLLTTVVAMLDRTDATGRFNFGLKYGGGHTLRWSGDSGVNVQNYSKEPLAVGESEVDLRRRIVAEPGKKLVTLDLSQIEARCLPYLAGDQRTIDLIAKGMSVYEVHARNTMGYTDPEPLKKKSPDLYFLAKCRVLALGYQAGWEKFQGFCAKYGTNLTDDVCRQTVNDFRNSNPKIVGLWHRMEKAFQECLGGNFEVELPSGRIMTYFNVCRKPPRKGKEKWGEEWGAYTDRDGVLMSIYGGLLVENLIQSFARDVFAEGLMRISEAGHEILFHVHDEVTVQVNKDFDSNLLAGLLTQTPRWCAGLPVGCEWQEGPCYMK